MDGLKHLALFTAVSRVKNQFGYYNDTHNMPPIDEVALCFPNQDQLQEWIEFVKDDPLLSHYRSERDTMHREDKSEWFDVRFEFISVNVKEDDHPWRIEAMAVTGGYAPLHDTMLKVSKGPGVIHASYKLTNPKGSAEAVYDEELIHLEASENMVMAAAYYNDYGRFSYWRPPHPSHGGGPFLKPRVNLRDSQ